MEISSYSTTEKKLFGANVGAMILHLGIGIAVTLWYFFTPNRVPDAIDTAMYVIAVEKCPDAETRSTRSTCAVARKVFSSRDDLMIGLVLTFVFFTASMHMLYASLGSRYTKLIQNENNYLRWIEYAISATIMLVIVGISSGVKDLDSMILFICALPVVMLLGNCVESNLAAKGSWAISIGCTVAAWVLLIGIFLVIIRAYVSAVDAAADAGFEVPSFVTAIVVITIVLFASFGFVQIFQMLGYYETRGKYAGVELSYITLSFISKGLLALLVASGLVARSMPRGTDTQTAQ